MAEDLLNEELKKALLELRKEEARKFDQTVDLIVNLQKFNIKKDSINLFINLPHKIKDKKIAAFLESRNFNAETITQDDFKHYNDKRSLKKLVKKFDFFIAQASLMPKVATVFGKVLGPAGKMPSPQLGIMMNVDQKIIDELREKVNKSVRIRTKEASIKIPIGKQSMEDKKIIDNIATVYNALIKALPKQKENIKNVEIKFTMSKPQKIKIK
jgi:large subunit ribosomal protein L1